MASLTRLIASCITSEKMSSLSPGMTKDQVISLHGRPDGYQAEGDSEVLRYTNKLVSGWPWDRADYYAILRGGKPVEYGAGQVRQDQHQKFISFLHFDLSEVARRGIGDKEAELRGKVVSVTISPL